MDAASKKMLYFGLIGLLIAGSIIAVFQVVPTVLPPSLPSILAKDGTVAVYFASTPSDTSGNQDTSASNSRLSGLAISAKPVMNITSLNVTIDSVMVHKSGEANDSGWTEISHGSVTLDLLKPTTVSTIIGSSKLPAGNITMIRLHVSVATATVKDSTGIISLKTVVVSSGKLEVPLRPEAHVGVQMTTSITLDRPHIVEGNGQIRLTPALHAVVNGPR
ncbi:hypothetical protein AUG19_03860 [archaeon 13_1_20CM_2_54_9]|nr:MAG: hypothetical protein AUJ07_01675 [Crenarchaeota archaeon 13_1_40CM_3_53_5]OLE76070.1 MAG: hypothetical protein AUG19_03860 [archaeon 13_1_20CM_2_54_9]TMI26978.1 MAG: DUF4382 domain-containing protein [Candidatus Bathyarchaeota archaeon]